MAFDLATILPSGGLAALFTWAGNAYLNSRKTKEERDNRDTTNQLALRQHQDGLTFELITAVRQELAAARLTLAGLEAERDGQREELTVARRRLDHFDEALEHLETIMGACDAEARVAAERRARQFITRMRRLEDARGALANEAQIEQSKATLEEPKP